MGGDISIPRISKLMLPSMTQHTRTKSKKHIMDRRVRIKPERTVETMVDMEPESDSTSAEWEIVGMLAGIDEFRNLSCVCTKTPVYVVYAHKVASRFCWYSKSTWKYHLLFQNIQIPNNVRELGDWCFQGWANCLHCVTFGPLSSLERIGVSCFEQANIENVSIPDGVHELCAQCFEFCKDLRRVTFGRSSSLERIGVACFARTNIDEVSIPESVRELGDSCFEYSSLRRLAFSSSSSLERISVGCFAGARIEEVSIHDGIRELCDQCFSRCWSLRRVIFGLFSSLKWIGNGCFAETSVEHMSIPDGVRELGDRCFSACSDLRRVTFGSSSSLERIGAGCFARCGLVEFTIPRSVREIGGGAFAECALPGGIICNDGCRFRAFDGLVFSDDCATCCCSYGVLSSVCIPDRVRELCDWCFSGCNNLRQVTFGSSSSLERIGVGAFSAVIGADWSASSIEEISIPDSVRELCDRCFAGCSNLRRVTFGSSSSLERIGVGVFSPVHQGVRPHLCGLEEIIIPDGVCELCDQCFKGCSNLSRVTFGCSSSLKRIGVEAFSACFNRVTGDMSYCKIKEISIPDSVRELCDRCFRDCADLCSVIFGSSSSLERIGVEAFSGKRKGLHNFACRIEEISIPDSVRELCDRCFAGCSHLRRVTFGSSSALERIGVQAFGALADDWCDGLSSMEDWVVVTSDRRRNDDDRFACGIEDISVPDSVRELGDQCFAGCSDLRRVTFGSSSSLERIGAGCFAGCGLVDFAIPRSVREIGGGAFAECALPGGIICNDGCRFRAFDGLVFSDDCATCCCSYGVLSSVCIPDRVRELCDWCFAGCSNLRRVTFGSSSSLERIFSGCKSLRQVTFGSSSSLERIGVGAFSAVVDADWSACSIEEISIPDSVRELCDRCFAGCSNLRRVTFGSSSSLERIGVKAFGAIFDRGCASTSRCKIEEISIPDSVRELCDQCFFGCSRLRHATFGSSSSLERIGSRCFEGCGLVEFAIPRSVRAIGGAAFAGCQFSDGVLCSKDCHFRVLDGLVFSDDYATCCFSYGVLSSVCIPDSVRELCDWCFCGCESLRQVTFGSSSSLARIGISCFSRTGLKEVNIPESVLELGDLCFTGCRGLRSVTFGSSSLLVRIGDGWIRSTHVYEASIPSGVHELCDKCFAGCKNLCRVTFGSSSSLERIGVRAFSATDSGIDRSPCAIEEISIPDCVRELCDECFAGCSRLRRVTFGSSSTLERIGVKAFGTVVDHKGYISMCRIEEISIPDSVRELCDQCFAGCSHLRRVTFGSSSTLERIGVQAFGTFVDDVCRTSWCRIEEISIPDSVRELCDQCFAGCSRLRRIIFGPGSSIERIGFQAFPRTLLHLQSE